MATADRQEILVGDAAELVEGKFKIIQEGALNIGVTRLRDGTVRAVRNWCPHKGAAICKGIIGGTWPPSSPGDLAYDREGQILICPWHGFEYDLKTGDELYRKVPTRLRFYEVIERDAKIYLSVSRRAMEAPKSTDAAAC
jgi:nitrite reductase/ring-hydroxylating ferredoxin subunit